MVQTNTDQAKRRIGNLRRAGWLRRARKGDVLVRVAFALVVGGAVTILLFVSGYVAGSDDALQVMGFDPDRARLITAMSVEALAVAAATIATAHLVSALVVGGAAFAAVFARTFDRETVAAVGSRGTDGTFDPFGWLLTAVTVVAVVVAIAWAAASLAAIIRRWLVAALAAIDPRRTTRTGRDIRWPVLVAIGAALLLIAGPVLGDMLNYAPDVRMRQSAPLPVGLFGGGAGGPEAGGAGPGDVTAPSPSIEPGRGAAGPVTSAARPWLAWRPSGAGSVTQVSLPPGWTGGTRSTADLSVYLPPGYAAGTRRYPVTYEIPWGLPIWQSSMHLSSVLDELIDGGTIPAQIVVFVSPAGGPYPDSECVDSADGREWIERWFSHTIVPAIDGRFRTLAVPAARAVMGFSQGGYCAPMLLFRHPNVVSTAIALSGYYESGIRSPQTTNAWRPFAGDPALVTATSPLSAVNAVPADLRPSLFVILSGDPSEPFYGPQYRAFSVALANSGIPAALLPSAGGHSWPGIRAVLPVALQTLAARQAATGVFRG